MGITNFINLRSSNNLMVKSEKQRLHLARLNINQKKENNRGWKGGRSTHNGYKTIRDPSHRLAYQNGYVPEHRLIMEKHLGRPLNKTEYIHHINGDKKDNRIENLKIMSQSEHKTLHNIRRKIKSELR